MSSSDARSTVVVVDNASTADVLRGLHQLIKTSPPTTDLVLAAVRAHHLPGAMARRVRKVRASDADALDAKIAELACASSLVVVATSAASFSRGWHEEVLSRVALYPRAISVIESASGGVMLYPPAVMRPESTFVPWRTAQAIAVRATYSQDDAQTVSAVLIVKNEEDVLDACLSALSPFVDELVVYDTGSTDATMEIARRHGAVLIEGYWDDHFGNARNRALDHATSDWVFQVDADEVVTGDVREFRARVNAEKANQMLVTIVSSAWEGVTSGLETHPVRLFRRGTARYVGALHEYPRPLDGIENSLSSATAPVRLLHSGYELGKVVDRDKTNRNVDMSRRELEAAAPDSPLRAEMLSNLARSLMWAARVDEAIEVFAELRTTPGNPSAVVMSGRAAVGILAAAGRSDEAELWLDTLARHGESAGNLAVMRARLFLAAGDVDGALAAVAPFNAGAPGGIDPWAIPFNLADLMVVAAQVDLLRGDLQSATETFLKLMETSPELIDLGVVLPAFVSAGRPVTDLVAGAPESLLARSIREASLYHPSGALLWFEGFHAVHPDDLRPVVAGNMFAARAGWQAALTWASRARELGLDDVCALRGLAERDSAPLVDRCMAWALLMEFFGATDAGEEFERLTTKLTPVESETVIGILSSLGVGVSTIDVDAPSAAPQMEAPVVLDDETVQASS